MLFILFPSPFHFSPVWASIISPLDCFNNFLCHLLSWNSRAFWAPYSDPQLNLFSGLSHDSPWWKFCSLQMELLIKLYPPLCFCSGGSHYLKCPHFFSIQPNSSSSHVTSFPQSPGLSTHLLVLLSFLVHFLFYLGTCLISSCIQQMLNNWVINLLIYIHFYPYFNHELVFSLKAKK